MMQGAPVVDPACLVISTLDVPFQGNLIPSEDVVLGLGVSTHKGHHSVILELSQTSHRGDLDEILVTLGPIHIIAHV